MKDIELAKTLLDLEKIKVAYVGKNGSITQMFQELRHLSDEEKKKKGQEIHALKEKFEEAYAKKKAELEEQELQEKLTKETVDISLPGRTQECGTLHPLTLARNTLEQYFRLQGFSVETGPEIEDSFHNFDALNIPSHHPARQSHDTFFIGEKLLRTHTSTVEIRAMTGKQPPFRMVSIGRVYRSDACDATHTPMFHQIEGLVIDTNITVAHLKGALEDMFRQTLEDPSLQIRFRPSFFPFTEPSFEVDIFFKGRWMEMLGCGMTHPNVLKNVGVDPSKYQGFAFGMGVERFTMVKYNLKDLRMFYENDVRFLKVFA